jgi:type I restriction enzyme S subunit
MNAVDESEGAITELQARPFGQVKKGYTCFEEGDVLFAKITPCMENGKATIASGLIGGVGFGSTEFHVLRPGQELIAKWALFFLRQECFRQEAAKTFRGAVGQQRVPQEFLEAHPVPLPPLAEQRLSWLGWRH